eukprot:3829916-Pyramimonas_sp.AAC.1
MSKGPGKSVDGSSRRLTHEGDPSMSANGASHRITLRRRRLRRDEEEEERPGAEADEGGRGHPDGPGLLREHVHRGDLQREQAAFRASQGRWRVRVQQ